MIGNEEMIRALEGILRIESVSRPGSGGAQPYGEGADKALRYMLALCDSLGFRTKNCDNRTGYAEIGEGDTMIGILVHLDVVPAGDTGWECPAYALTRKDGKLIGRGVVDNKGPAIACVYAMKDLLDSGKPLGKRVRIIFGLAEETAQWTDMDYYKETEERPARGFTPDASFPGIYGEKGIAHFTLSMPREKAGLLELTAGSVPNMVADTCSAAAADKQGKAVLFEAKGRSAHGSTPYEGKNAVSMVMADLAARDDLADCPFARFYNETIGFDVYGERIGLGLSDTQSGKLTLSVGTAKLTEDAAEITLDIRYPVTKQYDEIAGKLERAVAKYGVTVRPDARQNPVFMDKDGPWIGELMAAYRGETGDRETRPAVIGGGTYARAMDNIVAFGPMLPGRERTEHQPNEYILEEDFLLLRRIYRRVLENA